MSRRIRNPSSRRRELGNAINGPCRAWSLVKELYAVSQLIGREETEMARAVAGFPDRQRKAHKGEDVRQPRFNGRKLGSNPNVGCVAAKPL